MSETATLRILQVSDPHFGTDQTVVAEALQHLVQQLAPQVLVLSGDITQRARRDQFAAARAFVDALGIPQQLVIAGNHDLPLFNVVARAFWPYRGWRRAFGHELEPLLETPRLLVIGVCTTRRWRHKHGEVSPSQITRVASRLRAGHSGQLKLVITHQPLDVVTRSDQNNLLRGHAAARAAWIAAGADLFLAGHIHLPHLRALPGTEVDHCGLRQNLPMAVQAGTALSSRLRGRAPNSVNVVELFAPDAIGPNTAAVRGVVRRYDYQTDTGGFGVAAELAYVR